MLLRKINAILGLLATVFLLDHAIFHSVWMLSKGRVEQSAPVGPWILAGLMGAHAFISIMLAVSAHMEGRQGKYNQYPKMNRATIFQRISGVLLIIFTVLHITGATGVMTPPPVIHTIVPPIFFTIALIHTAISADKAFITLGIGNARFIKAVSVVVKVLCAVTLVACIIGFYLYVW